MALTYTANLQNRITLAVWGVVYTSLDADRKIQVDLTWTTGAVAGGRAYDALNEVYQLSQWFEQAASSPDTSIPTPAWESLFVARCCALLTESVRPERYALFSAEYERSLDDVCDTFSKTLATATDLTAAGVNSQSITLKGIRYYCMNHCVRRKGTNTGLRRRLFPPVETIDSELQWTLNYIYNVGSWNFRRRQVRGAITYLSVSDATWTEATKTVTKTSGFTNYTHVAGARMLLTEGTGLVVGEYVIASRTSNNAIVLEESCGATDGSTDLDGIVSTVTFKGLAAGDTFDSTFSRQLMLSGDNAGGALEWADSTEMAEVKAADEAGTGTPRWFHTESRGQVTTWHFSPFPDAAYTFNGAVVAGGPGTFATSTAETALATIIAKFPPEFGTVIRDMVLARVLLQMGASDGESNFRRANDQVMGMLPTYTSSGSPARQRATVLDVYHDWAGLHGSSAFGPGW